MFCACCKKWVAGAGCTAPDGGPSICVDCYTKLYGAAPLPCLAGLSLVHYYGCMNAGGAQFLDQRLQQTNTCSQTASSQTASAQKAKKKISEALR